MKPAIQMKIGLWGVIVFLGVLLIQYVRGLLSSITGTWITFTSLPLFVIYIFGILKSKLKITRRAFYIWCIFAFITVCSAFVGLLLELEEGDVNGSHIIFVSSLIFLPLIVPATIVVIIMWVGLRGLEQMLRAESGLNIEEKSASEKRHVN